MDGWKRNFWKRWRHGSCPEQGAKAWTRDLTIIFHFSGLWQALYVVSRDYNLDSLYVQVEYIRIKLNISRLLSMRVSRICINAFREARDRRRIDADLVWQFHRPTFSRKMCITFFTAILRCAHTLLQPVTHGSPSLRNVWTGKKRYYAATYGRGNFEN